MSIAQFADAGFAYPGNEILVGASLLIRPGDRLALVGPNGTGKSTALRLLAGDLQPDSGDVRILGRASVSYLRQSQELSGDGTLRGALMQPFADLERLAAELGALEGRLAAGDPSDLVDLARYGELQERYQRDGGYDVEARVKRLTADVGFSESDLARPVDTLSGGERGRLELAKVLVRQPDLLLLDEPTNHLDLAAIERLEAFLAEYTGAFVLVSHDRAFIRAVCREIVELENGKLVRYPFGYDKYVLERDARLERARTEFERQKEQVDKTEDFIRRNLAGQKTKQAQSRRKMLDKLERLERPDDQWQHAGKIGLSFQTGGDLGSKETLRAPGLTVGYAGSDGAPGATILRDVTVNIYRGDKLGIIGPNGSGKSTLLRTLIGELPPLAGRIEVGSGVRIGYFDQKLGTLDEELTLLDEIRSVRADLSPDAVRQYLAKFRFFGDDPFRTVRGLSGGERSRLAMAKIMLFPRNVLVLDEPTNHLDIPARETLEDALEQYEGTLLVVSHDRYFLDRICTRLLVIEGTHVEAHLGNYSDWRRRRAAAESERAAAESERAAASIAKPAVKSPAKPAPATPAAAARPPSESNAGRAADKEKARARRQLARRVETLEADVSKIEAELTAVRADLAGDHAGDWQKLHTLADRERELDALLARRISEWETASAALLNQSPVSPD